MLKLILADNQAIFRAGIAKVLAVEDDMRIVAQAQSVEQMMMAIDKFRAAVLIFSASFLPNYDSAISAATGAKTRITSTLAFTASSIATSAAPRWLIAFAV
jgi:DNA-binding NarL/FixJ family response regulator